LAIKSLFFTLKSTLTSCICEYRLRIQMSYLETSGIDDPGLCLCEYRLRIQMSSLETSGIDDLCLCVCEYCLRIKMSYLETSGIDDLGLCVCEYRLWFGRRVALVPKFYSVHKTLDKSYCSTTPL
jgi:hypothetical protein